MTTVDRQGLADHPTGTVARLRRSARDAHRRVFCLSVALDSSRELQHEEPSGVIRAGLAIPFAPTIREVVRHRPGSQEVGIASLLMGSQARLDSSGFAAAFGTLRFGSTPMTRSPHAELLVLAASRRDPLCDDELKATAYWAFARHLADTWGDYFGASSDDELLAVTRNFVDWALRDEARVTVNSGSRSGDGVLVAKVPHSRTFQVIDGHHRVAAAIARGETAVRVRRTWLSSETALQRRLGGANGPAVRTLPQPLPARELGEDWVIVRNCPQRLTRMRDFLERRRGEATPPGTFLDVGADYGWFVREFDRLGWRASGIEEDGLSVEIATSFHDLAPGVVVTGAWAPALGARASPSDAVSCLDLATRARHDPGGAAALVAALDGVVGSTLFVDAPDDDDASLGQRAITALVLDGTSLGGVVDLGANDDPDVPGRARERSRLLAFTR